MTENDQYVIQLRNNDIESLLYSNELTNINCNLILEYIKDLDLFQDIEYNFKDEKNRIMIEDFNKTEFMSYKEFEHVYAVTNLIPSYTTFFLDYVILTKKIHLPELFNEENVFDNDFEGFEKIPEDIKNIFYALTTTYKKILDVLSPNDDSKSSKMININGHNISYMTKVYYMVYYNVFYSKGILSNGEPNNISIIKEKSTENVKDRKTVSKKKKSENKIQQEQNSQEILDLNVFVKNISSTMTEYWMNDDYSWKEIQENLSLLQDSDKLEIFSKLQNKFDIDYSYDMKNKSFVLKLKIKN